MNTIAASAPADGHDLVAGLNFLLAPVFRNEAHVAAINERVAEVTPVKEDGAVGGRDAHPVAVITYTGDDAFHQAFRVHDALGKRILRRIRRSKTEDVGIQNRFGAEAGAEDIANDATDARG